jgi:hypothetical protein
VFILFFERRMKKLPALAILASLIAMTLGFGIEGKWEV